MKNLCLLFLALLCSYSISSQVIGSNESGNVAPQEAKASELTTGAYNGDINLFTGTYSGTYPLGSVSTPQMSFELNMNYGASFVTGDNPVVTKGIPYGEGWNVSIPTVTVKNDVYHKSDHATECGDENSTDQSTTTNNFTYNEGKKQGDVYWFAPELNIPGVGSGRAIFKYIKKNTNIAVFVLQGFEEYVELEYINGKWMAKLPNGLVYHFNKVQANYRAATNHRVLNYQEISDVVTGSSMDPLDAEVLMNVIMPKFEYTTWYCTAIGHLNFPLQVIKFNYEQYGQFDYFKEIHGYKTYLEGLFSPHEGYNINIGSGCNDMFIGAPTIYYAPIYSELLLKSIESWGKPHGVLERLDLNYGTEMNFALNMLDIDDPDVCRKDSLYSYKSVFKNGDGTDFDNWSRIVHPKSDRAYYPLNDGSTNLWYPDLGASDYNPSVRDPYLIQVDELNGGDLSYFVEKVTDPVSGPVQTIAPSFDHGILESPLIEFDEDDIVPGDIYEIKTEFYNSSGKIPFADISIVSGWHQSADIFNDGNLPNLEGTFTLSKGTLGSVNSYSYDTQRGEKIFNTFGNSMKWPITEGYQTSNLFVMPNLPDDLENDIHYKGLNIQIGGSNSDNNFSATPPAANEALLGDIPFSTVGSTDYPEAYGSYFHDHFWSVAEDEGKSYWRSIDVWRPYSSQFWNWTSLVPESSFGV